MKITYHDIRGATYTFDKTARTVTFSGLPFTIKKEYIFGIVNSEHNEVIYQIDRQDRGGTLTGNVLTYIHVTGHMNDSDPLYIVLDVPISILDAGTTDFTFSSGNLTSITYPDGTVDSFTYDINGDLDTITKT